MKILLVDDLAEDRQLLRYIAERHGHEVREAENGQEALSAVQSHRFDLIISDAMMPVMDGFQFLRRLRAEGILGTTRFVFYSSAYRREKDIELAIFLGADAYILKPKEPKVLWAEVEALLKRNSKTPHAVSSPVDEEEEYLRRYSEIVVAKLEEKIREVDEAKRQLQTLIDNLPDLIARFDRDLRYSYINPAITTAFGISSEKLIGRSVSEVVCKLGEQSERLMTESIRQVFQIGQLHGYEDSWTFADGEKLFEIRNIPEADETGNVTSVLSIARDITEQKRHEQERFNAGRMELIGQLTSGVAHEVRNPLNAILSVTEALFREEAIVGNSEYQPYIHHIRSQVERLSRLMNALLDLGKQINPTEVVEVSLLSVCHETLRLWNGASTTGNHPVVLTNTSRCKDIRVRVDAMRLQQVLLNLLENAAQHSPNGRAINLLVGERSGDRVVVRVEDAGSGIASDNLSRVFDPFFTTRKGGTGLGLALVKNFVESMGGRIHLFNNNPGPGCTAELTLNVSGG